MPSSLVGREAELATIADVIARAAAGTPSFLLITGEAGGGRTALLEYLANSPLLPRRRVRVVSIDVAHGEDPVLLAAEGLTAHAAFARLGGRRRTLAAFRKVLPDWIGAIPGWGDLLEAITSTAAALRRRKRDPAALQLPEEIEAVQKAARSRAVAILVDGAEGMTPPAADRLFRLLDTAEVGTRLLVIAACRPNPPGAPPPPVFTTHDRLPPARRVRVALHALDRDAVRRWLEVRLGGSVADPLIEALLDATGGLPRAIDARIAELQAKDALRRVEAGWIAVAREGTNAQPTGANAVDLGPLGADVRETLSAGAVLGDSFDALTVSRALDRDELWIEDRLAAATRLGVLLLVDDAWEVDGEPTSLYRFASAAVRAALRHDVAADRRAAWEARVRSG